MLRPYSNSDYEQLKALYERTEWYGGVFDEARDGRERLAKVIESDPEAIVVFEENAELRGTISIVEDGRVAMLYRFVVEPGAHEVTHALYDTAVATLKNRGHTQILVYSDPNNAELDERYTKLGMQRGGDYACYWVDV